ncbi:MAG: ATP-binding protein [Gammaproteobacteria bacterium]|nr:MAG: ATP-binding protein [Gammaproteobacteria bacterium]
MTRIKTTCSTLCHDIGARRTPMIRTLSAEQIRPETQVSVFDFATTADLPPLRDGIGQERASRAVRFALEMGASGYNLFVLGDPATDRRQLVDALVCETAAQRSTPADWCYLNDFKHPDRPRSLRLPAGEAHRLARDADQLIEDVRAVIPSLFREEGFQRRIGELQQGFERKQKEALQQIQKEAETHDLTMLQTPQGFAFAPVRDGKVLDNDDFQALPEEERNAISSAIETMTERLMTQLQDLPARQQELVRAQKAMAREFIEAAINRLVTTLRRRWQGWSEVLTWAKDLASDVLDNAQTILALEHDHGPGQVGLPYRSPEQFYSRYRVNLLIDHSDGGGAPVVFETHPTLENLVGRLEHRSELGSLVTDFTLIKPGALHRANGGYLLIEAERLLSKPFAWDALKRALFDGEIRIESASEYLSFGHVLSLDPEPIRLDVKVILLGARQTYYLLSAYDPDFPQLFKVPADLSDRVDRSDDNAHRYARLLGSIARDEKLLPLGPAAVARIVDHSARLVGDAEKLSAHTRRLADLVRESDHIARGQNSRFIDAAHVQIAIDAHVERLERIRDDIHERIVRGTVVIATQGKQVAQVNGLSVLQVGDFAFGQPSRITATARLGRGEILDIEREARLGGNIHSKAVMILGAFIGQRYAPRIPLSLHASLAFEQSYGGIEGDSATIAEVCALLSALGDIPLRQDIAVTGSMDQYGRAQAIGGANEKVEGFYDVCAARGLTGQQGVLLPADNMRNLMLRPDVVAAVAAGRFSVWAMDDIDDALELLSGITAGARDAAGGWSQDSFNQQVQQRVEELSELTRSLGRETNPGPGHTSMPANPVAPNPPGPPPAPEDYP